MTLAEQRERTRNKITMLLEAVPAPLTSKELISHPTLASEKLTPRGVGSYLRYLANAGLVKKYKNKTWGSTSTKAVAVATEAPSKLPSMYFVLNTTHKTVKLDVGGMRLPVHVET